MYTGALVKAFRGLAIEAYGVDVSQAAISNAPRELRGQLYCLDVTRDRLLFEDEGLDFITTSRDRTSERHRTLSADRITARTISHYNRGGVGGTESRGVQTTQSQS